MENRQDFYVCECENIDHLLVFEVYDDFRVAIRVHLRPCGLFGRIRNALRYIFLNRRSAFGDFDEFLLKGEDAERFYKLAKAFRKARKDEKYNYVKELLKNK